MSLRDEAYKALAEIKQVNKLAEVAIKYNMQNISHLYDRLGRLEELSKLILSYGLASKDKDFANEISKLNRFVFHRLIGTYQLGENIGLSVILCNRVLYEVSQIGNGKQSKAPKTIPKELGTEDAKKLMQIAIDGGLLNEDYSTTDMVETNAQKALFADIVGGKLKLNNKYKVFETLWGVQGLSKMRYKAKEETGKVRGGEAIERIFRNS